jgi:hypothetical protein
MEMKLRGNETQKGKKKNTPDAYRTTEPEAYFMTGSTGINARGLLQGAHTKGPALEMSHSKNVPSIKVPSLNVPRH